MQSNASSTRSRITPGWIRTIGPLVAGMSLAGALLLCARTCVAQSGPELDPYRRGIELAESQGRYREAISEFKEAMRLRRPFPEAAFSLGQCYGSLRDYEAAARHFRMAAETSPGAGLAMRAELAVAEMMILGDRYADAATTLRRVATLAAREPRFHELLGDAHAMLGQTDIAIRDYGRVLELTPDSVLGHRGLARCLMRSGDLRSAAEHAELAIARDPFCSGMFYVLALSLVRQGDQERAEMATRAFQTLRAYEAEVEDIENALRQSPMDAKRLFRLADRHAVEGNVKDALAVYERLVALRLRQPAALTNIGLIHLGTGAVSEARDAFRRAIVHEPTLPEAHTGLLRALTLLDDREGIAEAVVAWTTADPGSSAAWAERGRLRYRGGDLDAAIRALERSVVLGPDELDAANDLAWMYAERGVQLDRALELITDVVERRPSGTAYDTLAYVYERRREMSKALDALERAGRIEPEYPDHRARLDKLRSR